CPPFTPGHESGGQCAAADNKGSAKPCRFCQAHSGGTLHQQVQASRAVERWVGIRLPGVGWIHSHMGEAAQRQPERDPGFEPGEGSAQAEVDPLAEPDMSIGLTCNKEVARMLELALVMVGREEPNVDKLPRGDPLPPDLDGDGGHTGGSGD